MIADAIGTWVVASSALAIGWALISFIINFLTFSNILIVILIVFLIWGLLYSLLSYKKEGNHETNTSVRSR